MYYSLVDFIVYFHYINMFHFFQCVAIDFTGSNGDPRKPGTLHHFSQQMNGYEKAIAGVGGIVAKYDTVSFRGGKEISSMCNNTIV